MRFLKEINKLINWKLGLLGAVMMACVAYYPNRDAGFNMAIWSAAKQFLYTLFVGGSIVRLIENISVFFKNKALSIFLAVVIALVITTVLITAIHLFRGTPNPFETVVYTVLAAPPGFIFVAFITRAKHDKSKRKDS